MLTRLRGMDGGTWRLIGWAVIVGAVVAALVMMSVAVLLLLGNSEQAKQQRDAQAATLRVLVECTTSPALRDPPEKHPSANDCYLRQTRAQGDVLGQPPGPLKPYLLFAATCGAAHPGDINATSKCVAEALRKP